MIPRPDPDEDPGALGLIAMGLALAGGILLRSGDTGLAVGCFVAAFGALVAWVRT